MLPEQFRHSRSTQYDALIVLVHYELVQFFLQVAYFLLIVGIHPQSHLFRFHVIVLLVVQQAFQPAQRVRLTAACRVVSVPY